MAIKRDELLPVPGLSREIGLMFAGFQDVRAQVVKLISDMTLQELSARFHPSFHQIGNLVLHLGECEFWWIQAMAAKRLVTDEDRRFAHLDDSVETDFAPKGYDADGCIKFLDRIHKRSLETLSGFSDDQIDRLIKVDSNSFEGSLRWILHHLTDHEANHKGQIALMKRLMRENNYG